MPVRGGIDFSSKHQWFLASGADRGRPALPLVTGEEWGGGGDVLPSCVRAVSTARARDVPRSRHVSVAVFSQTMSDARDDYSG